MATYLYSCTECDGRTSSYIRDLLCCPACKQLALKRDYKAEGVGIGTGVRVSRDGTNLDQARLFLPSNEEFKSPEDPDGKKGAREWLDTHQPKETGGNNPLLDIERESF